MRLQWKLPAFEKIRKDPALSRMIDDMAEGVAERAGRGFDWRTRDDNRHRAIVYTGNARAKVVNARDNSLLKALGGG